MSEWIACNRDNVADVALDADSFLPSTTYELQSRTATGGGDVTLSGDYTGAQDALYEIEVRSDTSTNPILSLPQFSGIGNGTITNLTVSGGTTAQDFTVTLVDMGIAELNAFVQYHNVRLVAKDSGSDGNNITVSVSHSGISTSETTYSLPHDVEKGNAEFTDDEWDFGVPAILEDGSVPVGAPRFRFGNDVTVYRGWKEFDDVNQQYIFRFDPAIKEAQPAGTKVYSVSGARTVEVTDGVSTDNLSNIESIFDFLSEIQTNSTLLNVEGVVSNDYQPKGMGLRELNLRTESYIRNIELDGSEWLTGLDDYSADTDAPTETVTVLCRDNGVPGAEIWEVRGDVSGLQTSAITGVPYTAGPVNFTIPVQTPSNSAPNGTISVDYDGTGETPATLCTEKMNAQLGAQAQNKAITFTYTKRDLFCGCDIDLLGSPDEDCLGLEPEDVMGQLSAPIRSRMEKLMKLRSDRIAANVTIGSDSEADVGDIVFIKDITEYAAKSLLQLANGDLEPDSWVASTDYEQGDEVQPTSKNEYRYRVQNLYGGTSDPSEPTWPTTLGATVTDNGITWECVSKIPLAYWDETVSAMDTILSIGDATGTSVDDGISSSTPASVWASGKIIRTSDTQTGSDYINAYVVPTTRNGHYYFATNFNDVVTTDVSEPTWPTDGSTVTDNDVEWSDRGAYWEATTAYSIDHEIGPAMYALGVQGRVVVTTAGTSGGTEPNWAQLVNVGDTITDGTVVWTLQQAQTGRLFERDSNAFATMTADNPDWYKQRILQTDGATILSGYLVDNNYILEKFKSEFVTVLTSAGITPSFDQASIEGNECWQDAGDDHWWVSSSGGYLPMFTNVGYHSAKRNSDGEIYSTQEFFLYPAIGCKENLKTGDTITIVIDNVQGVTTTYKNGDKFSVKTVHQSPLGLSGGQDGDDTLTWRVIGSEDGQLADYALDLNSLSSYSDGGIGFDITPGDIAFSPGDTFAFSVEGGTFRWRVDSGAWSSDTDIEDSVSLSQGVSANFVSGKSPSHVDGDTYAILALSVNGPQNIRTPSDDWMEWTGSNNIEMGGGEEVSAVFLSHDLPDGITVTFQGSDDGFSTTPLSESLTIHDSKTASATFDAVTYTEYRLVVSGSGRIRWAWCGVPFTPYRPGKSKLITASQPFGTAYGIEYAADWNSWAKAKELIDITKYAYENNDGRIGFVTPRIGVFVAPANSRRVWQDLNHLNPLNVTNSAGKPSNILSTSFTLEGIV